MLFNSIDFAIFLPIVFVLYWFVTPNNLKRQNILLLLASYYFYSVWDFRFLFLLIFSTFLDYFTGLKMAESKNATGKRIWFWLSVGINLGFLGVFKYYDFFISSFAEGLSTLGIKAHFQTLNVILPVGISFYTFHGLSYVIDIYNNKIKPEKNFIDYAVFVSFFPLLVAGPIERATHLLPQIQQKRVFSYSQAADGLRQILWGLFKKIVIADSCAVYSNLAFIDSAHHSGSTLLLGVFCFTIQIYCDFSGYSDIAIGTARLFGIELLRNFAFPFFSRDVSEYWRRWHISLSSWFRDYLYIPLGGSKGSLWLKVRNVFIIFLVSGFWHGANWTYIVWGFINAVYVLPSVLFNTNRNNIEIVAKGKYLPTVKEFFAIALTFTLTVLAFVVFRAESMHHAGVYFSNIFSSSLFQKPDWVPRLLLVGITGFMLVEWLGREQQYAIAKFGFRWPTAARYAFYYSLMFAIYYFAGSEQEFIYFHF